PVRKDILKPVDLRPAPVAVPPKVPCTAPPGVMGDVSSARLARSALTMVFRALAAWAVAGPWQNP
ncbi:MAG: hypothetical protein LW715_10000, partial [Rhodobacter sp.]|nr:hypothetical protein [Rhodobacter sp.]